MTPCKLSLALLTSGTEFGRILPHPQPEEYEHHSLRDAASTALSTSMVWAAPAAPFLLPVWLVYTTYKWSPSLMKICVSGLQHFLLGCSRDGSYACASLSWPGPHPVASVGPRSSVLSPFGSLLAPHLVPLLSVYLEQIFIQVWQSFCDLGLHLLFFCL